MAAVPKYLTVSTGPATYTPTGEAVLPVTITIRRRSAGWVRFLWAVGRDSGVPRHLLFLVTASQVLRR